MFYAEVLESVAKEYVPLVELSCTVIGKHTISLQNYIYNKE